MAELRKRGRIWQAIFYDRDGIRRFRSTHCTDKRAADAAAGRYEREAQGADDATSNRAETSTSMSDAVDMLIKHREEEVAAGNLSPGTVDMYKTKAGHLVRVFEGGGPFMLSGLRARHMDDYVSLRRTEGAKDHTIHKELVTARCALKIVKRRELWSGDIDAIMPTSFDPRYKPGDRNLEPHELVALLPHLTDDHASRAAFAIATSANLSETRRAQRGDIGDSAVFVRGTKTANRQRVVPITKQWQRTLIDYALKYAQGHGEKLFRFDGGFDNALERACSDAGVSQCTSNDLRRTFAHWMRRDGVLLELIAPMMGHADTKMLERVYGKLSPAELAALMTGTQVAQTNADRMDLSDASDNGFVAKLLKNGAPGGSRTRNPSRAQDFKSLPKALPSPRKYLKDRDYGSATGTAVAQRRTVRGEFRDLGFFEALAVVRRGGAA